MANRHTRETRSTRRRSRRTPSAIPLFLAVVAGAGLYHWSAQERQAMRQWLPAILSGSPLRHLIPGADHQLPAPDSIAAAIVAGARAQEGNHYDAQYQVISYPNGDVPKDHGACTDVVVRSLRNAGYDLQQLIHEDKLAHKSLYPVIGTTYGADANIDHRRVPNQMVFFARFGTKLPTAVTPATLPTWQPGDFIYWKVGDKQHTGVVSDWVDKNGVPLVIHNGNICVEQDCLTAWPIIGHYRFPVGPQRSKDVKDGLRGIEPVRRSAAEKA